MTASAPAPANFRGRAGDHQEPEESGARPDHQASGGPRRAYCREQGQSERGQHAVNYDRRPQSRARSAARCPFGSCRPGGQDQPDRQKSRSRLSRISRHAWCSGRLHRHQLSTKRGRLIILIFGAGVEAALFGHSPAIAERERVADRAGGRTQCGGTPARLHSDIESGRQNEFLHRYIKPSDLLSPSRARAGRAAARG